MYKIFLLGLSLFISFLTHAQCKENQVIYINASGKEVNAPHAYLPFTLSGKADSVKLEQLYDTSFTNEISNSPPSDQLDHTSCVTCFRKNIQIISSIDINKDGTKELFILREWICNAPYNHNIPYNAHVQRQTYGQYEVWDVKTKKRVFDAKCIQERTIPISVNVIHTIGQRTKVTIDKKGSFHITSQSLEGPSHAKLKTGTFQYNIQTGEYKKE